MASNNTSHINTPVTGMNQDLSILSLGTKGYSYALNAGISDFTGDEALLQNNQSNILKVNFPEGLIVIGTKSVYELNRVLYFMVNPTTGASEIGEVINCEYTSDTDIEKYCGTGDCHEAYNQEQKPLEQITQTPYCSYRTIIAGDCLNFNIDFPVDAEYRVTDCGLNIYFTDNLNQRRFIYLELNALNQLIVKQEFFTVTGFDPDNCDLPIYSDELDCNKILFNPCFAKPCINFVDVVNLGSLKAGVYQFLIAYSDKNGNPLSNYFPASNIIPVFEKFITTTTDYDTNKALVIDINNIENQAFLYYNLVVAETIENFTEFKLVGTFPTAYDRTDRYTYTGNDNTLKKLTAIDIFFRRPYYETAKSITSANNYLFFSGLREYKQLNLQRAANQVKLYWQTSAMPEAVYSNPRNTFKLRTYQRDEVYSFGIIFEHCDGWETCAFHIPGNSPSYYYNTYDLNPYDIVPDVNMDVIDDPSCANMDMNKRWQVYNMAQVIPGMCEHKFTENCDIPQCWEAGDFGYYESTERYPNDPYIWGDLCGQAIRFHKMPDSCVSHIHDSQCGSKHYEENNVVYPIGVRVDHASVLTALNQAVLDGLITQEDKDKIKGYRIVRGNRSGNKSIIAKGLIYDAWAYTKDSKTYYYANYPYNDLSADYFISNDKSTYDQDKLTTAALPNTKNPLPSNFVQSSRWTFHSPDTHFVNPTLGNILKLETVEYGESEGFFNLADEQAKYKRLTFFARLIALGMGVAAALSATEEKDCVTYTIKSDYKFKQEKFDVDSNGKAPYGNVNGTLTLGTGAISTSEASGSWDGTAKVPEIKATQDNSVCLGFKENNKKDGTPQDTSQNKIIQGAISDMKNCKDIDGENVVEQYQKTTCTGTPHQLLSMNTDNALMQGLNNVIKILTGGTTGPQIIQQVLIGMKEMEIVNNLIRSLIPEKNYAIQYNSVGKYNNYTCVPNNIGIKQRLIKKAAYLEPTHQIVSDTASVSSYTTSTINNWNRESSVYIHADAHAEKGLLPPQSVNQCVWKDDSRVTMGEDGMGFTYDDLGKRFIRRVASYYASIKNFVPDQYGKIYNINYLETSSCTFDLVQSYEASTYVVFGGDTFINRFALKRKVPFFTQTRFKQLNGADVQYSLLGNIGYPNYYFDTEKTLFDRLSSVSVISNLLNPASILDEIVGLEDARLDVRTKRKNPVDGTDLATPSLFWQRGYIYLYSYGIPYFLVESDINVDYRHGQNNLEKDFYPHNANLEEWLQEKNVPIREDNTYFYNKTYSKQNKESVICNNKSDFEPGKECRTNHPNRIIYSESQDYGTNTYDNWKVFKANSFHDLPLSDGKLISVDGIESDKVFVRLENMSRVFNAYNVIPTDQESIQVETGGMFKSRPKEFVTATLGYAGSQHRTILSTEYGHIFVDAKRGNVFNLGNGGAALDELSKDGMKNWFKENLPFQILKDFPSFTQEDLDNNYKGIGLILAYDRRFHRFILTKLDYKVVNPNVQYNTTTKTFYILNGQTPIEVSINNPKYFCNKSWTISYNFFTKSWVSFHSFKPLYYNYFLDTFESGIAGSLWSHNVTNKSYQVYYGTLYPFIIEYITNQSVTNNELNSVEYSCEVIRHQNDYDYFHNNQVTFNKAIVYNERQCSGLLELVPRNENDMRQIVNFPEYKPDRTKILATNSENIWNFNNFSNLVNSDINNVPIFINLCANDYKELNPKALNYYKHDLDRGRIRSKQCKVRLINDVHSNYHFIFNFAQTNQIRSFR